MLRHLSRIAPKLSSPLANVTLDMKESADMVGWQAHEGSFCDRAHIPPGALLPVCGPGVRRTLREPSTVLLLLRCPAKFT